ncbi:spore coat associated protein CotJA [Alicyclobacillus pomorum]|uniref:spore coat associated protein CotJA n=1 Tax=Alicyclobacillus pomorum TaxID=204470 RepID=UPI0004122553|nr:spore coat associated protein CotJA [Alicyclobacillus pomorum]
MDGQWRSHQPFRSPFDPCPPLPKAYVVPPNQYITYQPEGLKQFSPREALKHGTLWPDLYSPYEARYKRGSQA